MKAAILSVGEEMLIGQTINTNATWIADRLNRLGVETFEIRIVTDKQDDITEALQDFFKKADAVVITGGLGPTKDDLTKDALCTFFNTELVMSEKVLDEVTAYLKRFGREMNELNRRQALVPKGAISLHNTKGTAPGLMLNKDSKMLFALPGVPHEMQYLMLKEVLPILQKQTIDQHIIHHNILTRGIGESDLALQIESWENALPDAFQLAYLPSRGMVKLRITAKGKNKDILEKQLQDITQKLHDIIGTHIWGHGDDTPELVLGKTLKRLGLSVATLESCTGGYLASKITSIPGSSAYFKGSIVSYSNEMKMKTLNVSREILETHGAVSKQVAEAMAQRGRDIIGADYGAAITGIAGPSGETPTKPTGTTWIAVWGPQGVLSKAFRFGDNRAGNIHRASQAALFMLMDHIGKS